ncbi:MAG: hypothetical protein LUF30_10460 [Lachnospiraceae bacterium]|nr:hypothetical protein [Lachnospiraceae bacterium]
MKKNVYLLCASVSALMLGVCGSAACAEEAATVPELTVTSDILGLADTGNKTTLKVDLIYTSGPGDINIYYYNEDGERVIYEDQEEQCVALDPVTYTGSAVLDLGSDVDDSLIDSSNAVVKLVDGNSYHADEMVLSDAASVLDGEWSGGQYVYTLDVGDLEWNTWGYDTSTDYNSGREWSIMGGDGKCVKYFTFEVSGITYDGEEVEAATFPVVVYTYGRTCTDLALDTEFVENTYDQAYTSGLEQSDEIQWNWYTEDADSVADEKPYMNDEYTDYFSVVWPEGTDASGITADDVQVTLYSKYGDEYTLSVETVYGEHEYAVVSSESETQIFVTYQQWAYIPVYSTMEITVANGDLEALTSYDICSVPVYTVQTGGGGVAVDHTVTCYNYYGVAGMTLDNAANTEYTLTTVIEDEDGNSTTYYYAEDEDGNGYLSAGIEETNAWGNVSVSAPEDAWTGDGTEIYHIAVLGNVVFWETRMDTEEEIVTTEEKTVDGEVLTFTRNISATKEVEEILADGAYLEDGYNLTDGGTFKWAWTMRYQSGWTTSTPEPDSLPYVDGYYPYGYEAGSSNPIYDNLEE